MASSSLRRASLAAVALASVFLLSACAPGTSPVEDYPGLPQAGHNDHAEGEAEHAADDEEADEEEAEEGEEGGETGAEIRAAWLEQGGKIAVTTFGSSSCPIVGTGIKVVEPAGQGNVVEVSVVQTGGEICTMDFAPHTTVFWTPMNITTTEELTVRATGAVGQGENEQQFDAEVVVPVK